MGRVLACCFSTIEWVNATMSFRPAFQGTILGIEWEVMCTEVIVLSVRSTAARDRPSDLDVELDLNGFELLD